MINKVNDGGQTDFCLCNDPSSAVIAGFGSGKTRAVWMKIFRWMNDYPDTSHGYFAPTHSMVRDIFVPEVQSFCTENKLACEYLESKKKLFVQGYAPIFLCSMHDPEAIAGFQIGNAALDEADLLTTKKAWLAWRKVKARCRLKMYKKGKKKKKKNQIKNQMALASTPEGFKFAHQAFKHNKTKIEGGKLFQMSTYDNAHNLPSDYIDELKRNYPSTLIDAYILGKFTNLTSGTIYTSFDRLLNNAPGIFPLLRETLHIGMDFNVQKMAAIIHVVRNGLPIAVNEFVGVLDTPAMIMMIRNTYPLNPIVVYPDATGDSRSTSDASKTDIKLLRIAGFKVVVYNSNPRVKDRLLSMNGLFCNSFDERRYLVNVDECPTYTDNLEQQAFDKYGFPDKESDTDHTNDAGGYFIVKRFGIAKPISRARTLEL